MRRFLPSLVVCCVLLSACGGNNDAASSPPEVKEATNALLHTMLLAKSNRLDPEQLRPADVIGLYAAAFLSMRTIFPLSAAIAGLEAQLALLPIAEAEERDYTVLSELGAVLEVDIADFLNRSVDRAAELEQYVEALRRLIGEAQGQLTSLTERGDLLQEEERAKRSVAQDLERSIRDALRDENYALAGSLQEDLARAEGEFSEVKTRRTQTDDTADLYEDLLEIALERLQAIEQNREILIAGLKVIDVPGIEDLRILEEGSGFRRTGSRLRNSTGLDAFGN